MPKVMLRGPSGRIYVAELEYAEGHIESTEQPWRGWRIRYHQQGENLPLVLYIDGEEERTPDEAHVALACDHLYAETVEAVRNLPRWRREVLDPEELGPEELYAELEHDLGVIDRTSDPLLVYAGELRVVELVRELERRRLSLPEAVRSRLSGDSG